MIRDGRPDARVGRAGARRVDGHRQAVARHRVERPGEPDDVRRVRAPEAVRLLAREGDEADDAGARRGQGGRVRRQPREGGSRRRPSPWSWSLGDHGASRHELQGSARLAARADRRSRSRRPSASCSRAGSPEQLRTVYESDDRGSRRTALFPRGIPRSDRRGRRDGVAGARAPGAAPVEARRARAVVGAVGRRGAGSTRRDGRAELAPEDVDCAGSVCSTTPASRSAPLLGVTDDTDARRRSTPTTREPGRR